CPVGRLGADPNARGAPDPVAHTALVGHCSGDRAAPRMTGMERETPHGVHHDETDIGRPSAYLALPEGTPVLDREGRRIGVVAHVGADVDLDLFYGVV